MGWEHDRYEAICEQCGHRGYLIESSDDWGRSARRFEGFENVPPDSYAVGRKREDPRQNSPRCQCGSTQIARGSRA